MKPDDPLVCTCNVDRLDKLNRDIARLSRALLDLPEAARPGTMTYKRLRSSWRNGTPSERRWKAAPDD